MQNVDTVNQEFDARVWIQIKYYENLPETLKETAKTTAIDGNTLQKVRVVMMEPRFDLRKGERAHHEMHPSDLFLPLLSQNGVGMWNPNLWFLGVRSRDEPSMNTRFSHDPGNMHAIVYKR